MMQDDAFHELAMKVLRREATADEVSAVKSLLAQDSLRREEFEALQIAHSITQATAPLSDALKATEPKLPAYRKGELQSAVRHHFKESNLSDSARQKDLSEIDWLRWIFKAGWSLALGLLVLSLVIRPSSVEFGGYTESLNRSLSSKTVTSQNPRLVIKRFERDQDFDQWIHQPFAFNEKARIWIDEEKDQLHILHRTFWFQSPQETTKPLPESIDQRQTLLESTLKEFSN